MRETVQMKKYLKSIKYTNHENKPENIQNRFSVSTDEKEENKLMRQINEITFADATQADIKRENANVNGNTAMGTMLQYGSTVSKEFCKKYMLKKEHAAAHENGDIHIHDLDFYNMGTLTCCQINLRKLFKDGFSTGHGFLREPQDIMSYTALAAIAIQSNQNDQHGGQSVPMFDFDMAPGVAKTFKKVYRKNFLRSLRIAVPQSDDESIKVFLDEDDRKNNALHLDRTNEERDGELEDMISAFEMERADAFRIQTYIYDESVKETDRRTYQAMEAFIHNLNTMHSRAGAQVPFSNVNFGTDISPEGRMATKNLLLAQESGLGNGETPIFPILIFKVKDGVNYSPSDPNYDMFRLAIRVSSKRLFPNFSFLDSPFNLQYYIQGKPESEVAYMGCRTRVMGNVCGEELTDGRGNLSFTTVNLPRLGILHGQVLGGKTDIDGFYKDLDKVIDLVIDQLLERYEVQCAKRVKNFPFLMGQGIWRGSEDLSFNDTLEDIVKQGTLTIGFIGLAESLVALTGKHHGESEESRKLGYEIIEHMRKRMDEATEKYHLNFGIIATPAEGISGRFTKIDRKKFGKIKGVTDREYYTNSFHVPVYYPITAFEKIKIEAPYHNLTNAGHISYVEVDGDPSDNCEAFESIVRAMKDAGIGYGSINHPVDRDPVCGFTGIIGDTCPACGRTEGDVPFERIRRITGYLVGTLDRFNNAKREEVNDRVKHMNMSKE